MEALLEPVAGSLDSYLNPVRSWIDGRAAAVQTEIGSGGPAWTAPLDSARCLSLVGNVSATFNVTYGATNGSATMNLTLNGSPVPIALGLSAFDPSSSLRVTGVQSDFTSRTVGDRPAQPRALRAGHASARRCAGPLRADESRR